VKIAIALVAAMLLGPTCALAQPPAPAPAPVTSGPAPTDDSIRHLLQVMNARELVDNIHVQMKSISSSMLSKLLQGKPISPEQQQAIDTAMTRIEEAEAALLSWEKLEPLYLKIYRETFTQAEVDGMITFYSSPVGQAVVRKLPQAMQSAVTTMQQQVVTELLPKLTQITQDLAQQLHGPGQ
jgi:hypothetical protein